MNYLRIDVAKAGSYCQLWIHAAEEDVNALVYAMLHAHRVRAPFPALGLFAANALRDLITADVNTLYAES